MDTKEGSGLKAGNPVSRPNQREWRMTLQKIILFKIEVFFLKHFEICLMNTCQIDWGGVFVLPFILFCQIINENHSSKRGLDQGLLHKRDNKEHRSYEGRGVGERKGTGPTCAVGARGISCCCLQHLLC